LNGRFPTTREFGTGPLRARLLMALGYADACVVAYVTGSSVRYGLSTRIGFDSGHR